ncbi:DUF5701 family protein [Brachybacterium sp. Z12]|uniref:DUF5701 family protein n=1 Tax=Brachybacterium sp. Z12 TaxID=2759167 RepID=UPI00292A56B7|nr:DUF5701 family protein [Brachybacterium sp. Z12]
MHDAAAQLGGGRTDALLALDPSLAPASALAPLMRRGDRPGFVVEDMTDVDRFDPTGIELPDGSVYLVEGLERGDDLSNWTPEEALPAIAARDRPRCCSRRDCTVCSSGPRCSSGAAAS